MRSPGVNATSTRLCACCEEPWPLPCPRCVLPTSAPPSTGVVSRVFESLAPGEGRHDDGGVPATDLRDVLAHRTTVAVPSCPRHTEDETTESYEAADTLQNRPLAGTPSIRARSISAGAEPAPAVRPDHLRAVVAHRVHVTGRCGAPRKGRWPARRCRVCPACSRDVAWNGRVDSRALRSLRTPKNPLAAPWCRHRGLALTPVAANPGVCDACTNRHRIRWAISPGAGNRDVRAPAPTSCRWCGHEGSGPESTSRRTCGEVKMSGWTYARRCRVVGAVHPGGKPSSPI